MKTILIILTLTLIASVGLGSIYAQNSDIPSWIKNTALWYGEGKITDAEFIDMVQFLVSRELIAIPTSENSELQNENKNLKEELLQVRKQAIKDIQSSYDDGYSDGSNTKNIPVPRTESTRDLGPAPASSAYTTIIEFFERAEKSNKEILEYCINIDVTDLISNNRLESISQTLIQQTNEAKVLADRYTPNDFSENESKHIRSIADNAAKTLQKIDECSAKKTRELQEYLSGTDSNCIFFCDSTNYEPSWTRNIGQYQVINRCLDIIDDDGNFETSDYQWCNEFSGYLLDNLLDNLQ